MTAALLCVFSDGDTVAAEACTRWAASPLSRVTIQVIRLDPEPQDTAKLAARIAEAAGEGPYALLAVGAAVSPVLRAAESMPPGYAVGVFLAGAVPPAETPIPAALPGRRVTVLCGASDEVVPPEVAAGWRTRFDDRCAVRVFDGGSGFLRTCAEEVLRCVQQDMAVPGPGLPGATAGSYETETAAASGEADSAYDWTSAAELVRRLTRIPAYARRFAIGPAEAARRYRVDAELARELAGAGLPHVPGPDGPILDEQDLVNVALCLRRRIPERAVMRYWADGLGRPPGEARTYEVDYVAACPAPGHPGPCEFECRLPGERETVGPGGEARTPLTTATVHLTNDWPDLPEPMVEAVRDIVDVGFHRLPEAVRWDVDLLLRQRVGDCAAFAKHLVAEGARRGLRTRAVLGLIVAAPYSTPHYWAEVLVGDRWVPVDPGLIRGMAQWGVLPPGWSPERSPGAFLAPLSTRHAYIVTHRGMPVSVVFPTRLVARPASLVAAAG